MCCGKFRVRKIGTLWIQVFTYSIGIYIVMCMIPESGVVFSIKKLIEHALPMLTNQYWFFKYYVLLVLISPVLNRLINSLDQAEYQKMLLLLLVLFSVIPSVNVFGDTFGTAGGYSLIWFVLLYLLAAYVRMWTVPQCPFGKWYLVFCGALCLLRIAGTLLGGIFGTVSGLQCQYNSPGVVLAAICLFLWALNKPSSFAYKYRKAIHGISGLTFGVYLIHDHGAISDVLWNRWVNLRECATQPIDFAVRAVLAAAVIFICGITVEWIRLTVVHVVEKIVVGLKMERV